MTTIHLLERISNCRGGFTPPSEPRWSLCRSGLSLHSQSWLCLRQIRGGCYKEGTAKSLNPLNDSPRQERIQMHGEVIDRSPARLGHIFRPHGIGSETFSQKDVDRNRICVQTWDAADEKKLLLEEIFESLPRIVVPRRRSRGGTSSRWLRVGRRRSVLLHRGAKFVKFAVVLRVLRRDALRDRLRAFKLRAGIEIAALFAAVQFQLALGARSVGIESRRQHRPAIRAARACNSSDHARRARPKLIGSARPARGWLTVVRFVFLFAFFRVAVPAVTVLSIHKRLRPPVPADCNGYNLCFCAVALANLAWFQSDCYTRPDWAIIPLRFLAELRASESRRWVLYVFNPLGVRSQAGL
jgi:hypothetical protein